MYMIVVGAGSIGASLIEIAVKEKNNVVVIEANDERARLISSRHDITVLNENATTADTLREAGAERADALIATTSDDAVNLMVVSIAEGLEIPSIVSVVNEQDHADFFRRLGANVMENPEDIVANHLYNAVKRPRVTDYVALSQGDQLFRLAVGEESPLVGRPLSDSAKRGVIPEAMLAIAVERDTKRTIAETDAVIESGDIVTFFSLERPSDEIIDKLSG
ncbi:MAG: TrkA family potassium uptake protein [Candidatus Bipolaricaulota bacterium]|nr:MAG: TrkA family potassium uptake protein [Candidatus Bipolaricaulota bacterium]